MKPPMPYFGSKSTIAPWIVSLLPDHDHYIEPFAGSLAVLLAKPPSRMETVNDLDAGLMTFWRVLRDRPEDLTRACALTPHARAEQQLAYESATDELEIARRVWVLLTQGRSGMFRRTGWRHFVDPSSRLSMPGYLDAYRDRFQPVVDRIAGVSLECMPALDLIRKYGDHPRNLLYVDPPYLGETRGYGASYRHELRTGHEHRELSDALHGCQASIVLSGYESPLYDDLFADWHRCDTDTWSGHGRPGSRSRTEVLWSNRPVAGRIKLWEEETIPDALLEVLVDVPWPMWREAMASTVLSHDPGCACEVCEYVKARRDG